MKKFNIYLIDKDQRTYDSVIEGKLDDKSHAEELLMGLKWIVTNDSYVLNMKHVVRFKLTEVVELSEKI
jgi:hypothetical protein